MKTRTWLILISVVVGGAILYYFLNPGKPDKSAQPAKKKGGLPPAKPEELVVAPPEVVLPEPAPAIDYSNPNEL